MEYMFNSYFDITSNQQEVGILEHPNLVFSHHFPPFFHQGKAPPRAKASATKAKATKPAAKAAAAETKAVPEKAKKAKRLGRIDE